MQATIKDTPYSLKPFDGGWVVTANATPTDHFLRSYSVRCGSDGRPVSCTCRHFYHRRVDCKHMALVEQLWREQNPGAVAELERQAAEAGASVEPVHSLVSGTYKAAFQRIGDLVHLRHYCRGELTKSSTMTVEQGRQRWRKLLAEGWQTF